MIKNSAFVITPRLRALNKGITRLRSLRTFVPERRLEREETTARLSKLWMLLNRLTRLDGVRHVQN